MTAVTEHSAKGLTMHDVVTTNEYTIGGMHTLDKTGDSRIMWDSRNKEEVEAAKLQFDTLLAQGYAAFSVEGKKGKTGSQIREFDPKAERIIFTKANVGG